VPTTGEGTRAGGPRAERWHLEDEAEFLRRSLADAAREHEAGDLGDEDYALLERRDRTRLDEVAAALEAIDRPATDGDVESAEGDATTPTGETAPTEAPGVSKGAVHRGERRRRRRRWAGVTGAVLLSAALVLLVLHLAAPRLLGETSSGTITLNTDQLIQRQLAQASKEVNLGTTASLEEALGLYQQILKEDPNQPQALAEAGYLQWEAGYEDGQVPLQNRGESLVRTSIAVQPDDYAAHLFLGVIELRTHHDPSAAVTQFATFLAQHPPAAFVTRAKSTIAEAYTQAGQPVPAQVAAAG
jgi:hypothetical protein